VPLFLFVVLFANGFDLNFRFRLHVESEALAVVQAKVFAVDCAGQIGATHFFSF
jgi:hypothetical protein